MYKCNCCGAIFEEPMLVSESRGEYWGVEAYELMYYCPNCGDSGYDEYCEDEDEEIEEC